LSYEFIAQAEEIMSKIWQFTPNLPYEIGLLEWLERCRLTNREELVRVRPSAGGFAPEDFPVAVLQLTLEYFSADCFSCHSYTFVSQDFRDAVSLGPRELQYLPVDSTLSAPLPRSKNYMIMHVPGVENISDVAQSDYMSEFIPGRPESVYVASSIAVGPGAKPKRQIFRDQFFRGFVFCTDELAARVLQRHCTGARFYDPENLQRDRRYRTLRGTEECELDWVQIQRGGNLIDPIPDAFDAFAWRTRRLAGEENANIETKCGRLWSFFAQFPPEPKGLGPNVRCTFANNKELCNARPVDGEPAADDFPVAQLEIPYEDFSVDCFSMESFTIVSQDLRETMALGPHEVQYLPVDATLSAPLPRSKQYMIMHVLNTENVCDVDQSVYRFSHSLILKDSLWPSSIAIRRDAAPKHEIFHDAFFRHLVLCTDRLALRILRRDCSGVQFSDLNCLSGPGRFRTLRGIEDYDWNPEMTELRLRLLQVIP
jgi:hypothetical protein